MSYAYICKVKENIPVKELLAWHQNNLEQRLSGRYITGQMIAPLLTELEKKTDLSHIGNSVLDRPIHAIQIGDGKTRVLMWSQMHGNESTTTKAVFDLLIALTNHNDLQLDTLLEELTICIVPILNPDGAQAYTRLNANNVDLNRDAQMLSQPESIILSELFTTFKPDVCFNLHGQRTIYGFEATKTSSVLSFLSPSADGGRSITLSRKRSMAIISAIYDALQPILPNQIGRYDDGFNFNCVGDSFQMKEVPTVLFEAGHAPDDYSREQCRGYTFTALIIALQAVALRTEYPTTRYFDIPEHQKCYCDILISNTQEGDIGVQYQERLENGKVVFVPLLANSGETSSLFGHTHIDARKGEAKITFDTDTQKKSDIVDISLDNGIMIRL